MLRSLVPIAAIGVALATPAVADDVRDYGPEVQANTYTSGDQDDPIVGTDAVGRVTVTWSDRNAPGGEGQARSFGSGDGPTGPQFPVDVQTPFDAAVLAGGELVVTGEGIDDTGGQGVSAAIVDSTGAPVGGEFVVNDYTTNQQRRPEVAAMTGGGFVVAWTSYGSIPDPDDTSFPVRRFDAAGNALGVEMLANTYTPSAQRFGDVAGTPDGGFVVVWHSYGSTGTDGEQSSIQLRRFASDGSPTGPEFQVNTFTTGYQDDPKVTVNQANRAFVVWRSDAYVEEERFASVLPDETTRGQVVAPDGSFVGAELLVDESGDPGDIAIAAPSVDRFVTVRRQGSDLVGGLVDAAGAVLGTEFAINAFTTGVQSRPSVTATPCDGFVVAWKSESDVGPKRGPSGRSFGDDDEEGSIQVRRFDLMLFGDGFETGATDRWPFAAPPMP